MIIDYFIKGIISGIIISISLGPVAILTIQRVINKGYISGLASGFGATLADTFYAAVAGFGLSFISNFMETQAFTIKLVGGLFLIVLGIGFFKADPTKKLRKYRLQKRNLFGDFISIFFLTLSNPFTIAILGASFAGLGMVHSEPQFKYDTETIVLGVFAGTTFWWITLTMLINKFRNKIRLRKLFYINKVTGAVITILGIIASASVFFP